MQNVRFLTTEQKKQKPLYNEREKQKLLNVNQKVAVLTMWI